MNTPTISDPAAWHRRLCFVNDWIALSGDLDTMNPDLAIAQLAAWDAAGITDIIDVRDEWSDESFVATHAPHINYVHLGTHDDGGWQEDSWFEAGLAIIREVRERGGCAVVHCHMGVNRAPSMAFRMLLDAGVPTEDALDAIRAARPIAAILYADAAISHHLRSNDIDGEHAAVEKRLVREWHAANPVDTYWVISRIRQAEG